MGLSPVGIVVFFLASPAFAFIAAPRRVRTIQRLDLRRRASSKDDRGEKAAAAPSAATESSITVDGGDDEETNVELLQSVNVGEPVSRASPRKQQQSQQASLPAGQMMAALGTSPRRIFLSVASATGVALAGNLFGVTSRLLRLLPEDTVEASGLDTYFPRGDYKRVSTPRYTFLIPKEWVADTSLELAKAQARTRSLDMSMTRMNNNPNNAGRSTPSLLPDVAFGPPGGGGSGDSTNVSVIVSQFAGGLSMSRLGPPTEAAETFLKTSIAPEGS